MKYMGMELERYQAELADTIDSSLEQAIEQLQLMTDSEARLAIAAALDQIDIQIRQLVKFKVGLREYLDLRESDASLLNRIYMKDFERLM